MDVLLLDTNLISVGVLDTFDSLIWSDRYNELGDFEIIASVNSQLVSMLATTAYLAIRESESLRIMNEFHIRSDSELGNKLVLKGPGLEFILKYRIVWKPTILTGSFQEGIYKLLNENAINPTDATRKITRLTFEYSTDPRITSLLVEKQYFGEFLYDVIWELCVSKSLGFKITPTDDGHFNFKLYYGEDRSYEQEDNSYVVFSPKFENIMNGDYTNTNSTLKTITLVAGEEGIGSVRKTEPVPLASGAGLELDRREMFSDASSITKNVEGQDKPLTDKEYRDELIQRGLVDLSVNTAIESFSGQIDPTTTYVYGTDFFLGDVVQVANEYGHEARSMVTEITYAQDLSGTKIYPTFNGIG